MAATPLVDPSQAMASLDEQNMQSMQRLAEGGKNSKLKEKKLREACQGFEALFIQKMWEGMRASLPKEGLLHSREEQFWQGMYDQELGKSLAANGGIGLADMMMSQLGKNLHNASEIAANSTTRRPMAVAPVPLLPPVEKKPEQPVAKPEEIAETEKASPVESALADLYSGLAEQPSAPSDAPQQVSTVGSPGLLPNATPDEIQHSLNEFAAQLGMKPIFPLPQTMGMGTIVAENSVVAQALRSARLSTQAQNPPQTGGVTSPASAMPAASGQTANGEPHLVKVTTITNMPHQQQRTKQNRSTQQVASTGSITNRSRAMPHGELIRTPQTMKAVQQHQNPIIPPSTSTQPDTPSALNVSGTVETGGPGAPRAQETTSTTAAMQRSGGTSGLPTGQKRPGSEIAS